MKEQMLKEITVKTLENIVEKRINENLLQIRQEAWQHQIEAISANSASVFRG